VRRTHRLKITSSEEGGHCTNLIKQERCDLFEQLAWQQEAKKEGRIDNVCFNGLVLLLSMRLNLEMKLRNRH